MEERLGFGEQEQTPDAPVYDRRKNIAKSG